MRFSATGTVHRPGTGAHRGPGTARRGVAGRCGSSARAAGRAHRAGRCGASARGGVRTTGASTLASPSHPGHRALDPLRATALSTFRSTSCGVRRGSGVRGSSTTRRLRRARTAPRGGDRRRRLADRAARGPQHQGDRTCGSWRLVAVPAARRSGGSQRDADWSERVSEMRSGGLFGPGRNLAVVRCAAASLMFRWINPPGPGVAEERLMRVAHPVGPRFGNAPRGR